MRSILFLRNLIPIRNLTISSPINCNSIATNSHKEKGKQWTEISNVLEEVLHSKNDLEKIDWTEVKEIFKSSSPTINRDNINSLMIANLASRPSLDAGKHFIRFLQKNEPLNLGTVCNIFNFYHTCYENGRLESDEQKSILEIYDKLKSKISMINPTTLNFFIAGLSVTEEWRECFNVYEKILVHGPPSTSSLQALITSCFRNNEPDIGLKYLNDMITWDRIPLSEIYASWIDYCVRNFKSTDDLLSSFERMLNFVCSKNIILSESSAKLFHDAFSNHIGWKNDFVNIYGRGQCPNCKNVLQTLKITEEEYKLLRDALYKEVMIGKNVFVKSNPEEIKLFTKFVKLTSPYDIVIDGLNVAYCVSKMNTKMRAISLAYLVKYLLNNGFKNILILGRKHMKNWSRKEMNFIENSTKLFLVDDLSYDDTFLLYAGLSGPNTYFISRDLMRSHQFLLSEEKLIFRRWQETHQFMVNFINYENGTVKLTEPLKISPYAQKNVNWHIPYFKKREELGLLKMPYNWICLKPK